MNSPGRMGKPDTRQPKITFDKTKQKTTGQEPCEEGAAQNDNGGAHTSEIKSMFQDLKTSLQGIDKKMDDLAARMDGLTRRMDKQDGRMDVMETRVTETEESHTAIDRKIRGMDKVLTLIQQKNEDLEARSRRNNVRITGVAETTNIAKMEVYVETMMSELFGSGLSQMFLVERAHRTLGPQPQPGAPPRAIIARILNYRDRDTILRMARDVQDLQYQGNHISIFPDFTMQVQAARREFVPAKKIFQQIGTKYSLIYPAKLRVQGPGKPSFFVDAKAALKYAKQLSRDQKNQPASEEPEERAVLSDIE